MPVGVIGNPNVQFTAGAGAGGGTATLVGTTSGGWHGQGTILTGASPAAGVLASVRLATLFQITETCTVLLTQFVAPPAGTVFDAIIKANAQGLVIGFDIVASAAAAAATLYRFNWTVSG